MPIPNKLSKNIFDQRFSYIYSMVVVINVLSSHGPMALSIYDCLQAFTHPLATTATDERVGIEGPEEMVISHYK